MNTTMFVSRLPSLNKVLGVGLTAVTLGIGAASLAHAQSDLDALIKAAKAEPGTMTAYSAATENVAKRTADAFQAKYGIRTQYSRFNSAQLMQRYASEGQAGTFAADILFLAGGAQVFAEDGIKKGWVESVSDAGIPAMRSGEYPQAFNRGASAIVQVAPWMIAYNTEKLKGADVPKDWPDLLKPHLKGQILLANPGASSAYLDFWAPAIDKYGVDFFKKFLEQNPRQYPGGVPAVQALGAGEGMLTLPVVPAQVEATRGKGAPLATQVLDLTSGVEMQVILTARAKSKNPATARLMAHYVMTREGNAVYNDDPGGLTIFDTSKLPKLYQPPKPATAARAAEVAKLLGF